MAKGENKNKMKRGGKVLWRISHKSHHNNKTKRTNEMYEAYYKQVDWLKKVLNI